MSIEVKGSRKVHDITIGISLSFVVISVCTSVPAKKPITGSVDSGWLDEHTVCRCHDILDSSIRTVEISSVTMESYNHMGDLSSVQSHHTQFVGYILIGDISRSGVS